MRNINKNIVSLFFLMLFLSFAGGAGADENRNATISLTEVEKVWLQEHPVIRVANEMDWPPFDFNESGIPQGLVIDHIKLLAGKIGIKVEFINGYTWSELVSLFQQRKIDVMPVFYQNDARQKYTLFTKPYYIAKESQINNIQLSNFVNMTEEEQQKTSLHIGVRDDWPLLHQIISKAMETVGEAEMKEIERRWADVTIVKPVNWTLVFQAACVIGVMVFLLFWHNRKNLLRNHSPYFSQSRVLKKYNCSSALFKISA